MAKDTTLIDPLFPIPIGAEDEFERSRDYGDPDDEFSEWEIETDSDDITENELETPTTFVVINQKMIRHDAGNDTVDVVAETDAIAGAVKYELRVVKV